MIRRIRRVRLPANRREAVFWLVVLVALGLFSWRYAQPETLAPGIYQVERVVDGDTLVLANQERVRLIGADTPETVKPGQPAEPWGRAATEFTRRFVAGGEVRLEFDGRRKDRYGRHLAHVWVGNRMLEEELIRAGLATAETRYPYSAEIKARFVAAQAEAQASGRGIWSRRAPPAGDLGTGDL